MLFILPFLSISAVKLSHVNALLPFRSDKSKILPSFEIQNLGDSCVSWSSSNPSIIRVTPTGDGRCSKSAKVEVLYFGPTRLNTLVFAETKDGSRYSCNVYTDEIKKIEILTNTRTIYADSLPQQISLQGFDGKQNIFTSIGDKCEWTYDTKYFSTDKSLVQKDSLTISLLGRKVGKSVVKARLNDLESSVEISIVEQLSLLPSGFIRALPGVNIHFSLCSSLDNKRKSCKKEVDLSSGQYSFKSENDHIVSINNRGDAKTVDLGVSTINACDSLSDDNAASTIVNVTLPSSAFQKKQYILQGQRAVFNPKVYDEYGEELYGSDQIEWEVEGDYDSIGENTVYLKYWSFSFPAVVVVCSPITVLPDVIVLPTQSDWFSLRVAGGSGLFSYKVIDKDLCEVNDNQIRGLSKLGETYCVINDLMIPQLSGRAKIIVSKLKKIDLELNEREAYVGGIFKPKCQFISQVGLNFSVPIPHEIISTNVIVVPLSLEAKSEGFSSIYCHVKDIKSEEIKVSVINRVSYSFSGRASPNSHIPLHYTGGPLKWDGQSPPKVDIICDGVNAKVFKNYYSVDNEYTGFCSLNIQNKVSPINPYPILATVVFEINVSNVRSLKISPVDPFGSLHENCNSVPKELRMEWRPVFNAVPNHQHSFYVFAFDKSDNVINYYSANQITFTVDDSLIERVLIDEDTGASIFKAMIQKSSDVLAQTPNAQDYSLILNVINPIVIESNKMIYYQRNMKTSFAINGGSGFFDVQGPYAKATNTSIEVHPQSLGHFVYSVSDMCTDQEPVTTELDVVTIKRLQIDAPDVAVINSEVLITVNAFSEEDKPIHPDLISKAGITLKSPPSVKQSSNSWIYTPTSLGNKTISSSSIGSAHATKVITIIPPIKAHPDNIVILPKESITIDVNGPSSLVIESDDPTIAKIAGYSIIGISPGNTTARVYLPSEKSLTPFIITIRVLNPIELITGQSTQSVIEGGTMALSIQVLTDGGIYPALSTDWNFPRGVNYKQQNASSVLLKDLASGTFLIHVSAYNLNSQFKIRVDPKFALNVSNVVILPPGASFTVTATSEIPFTLKSMDEGLVTVSGRSIISNEQQGTTVILATAGSQVYSFAVDVIAPAALIFNRTTTFVFQAILVDYYGRSYTSLQGVRFSASGTGFVAGAFDENGFVQIGATTNKTITVYIHAKTQYIDIGTEISLALSSYIAPKNPIVLQGSSVQFYCSSGDVRWRLTDGRVGYITPAGIFSAITTGRSTLICDRTTSTPLKVVSLKGLKIERKVPDQFQVFPVYNENVSNSFVQKPSDFIFKCGWDSNKCGNVRAVSNISGYFCIVERISHHKCPEYSELTTSFTSSSAKIKVKESLRIPFVGLVDFGIPNEHVVNMTSSSRKVTIPLVFGASEITYTCPKGWSVSFQNTNVIVRAPKNFKGEETISFTHIQSSETIKTIFRMIDENDNNYQPNIHQREAEASNNVSILLVTVVFIIISSVAVILFQKNSYN